MEIAWPDKVKIPTQATFQQFVQRMANRIMQGHYSYGPPDRRKRYMTRMAIELKEYKRTGNAEHLYNVANYAFLECFLPENVKFHFDATAASATRGKV